VSRPARRSGPRSGSRSSRREPASIAPLERYRELIDDWAAFEEALSRPEPTTLRVNRLRATVAEVRAALEAEGFTLEELPNQPGILCVLDGPRSVSDTWGHWAGDFYIQQASTAVAVGLLDPQPGERVLDLCAAPGGKTTHIAEAMQGEGEIVAVEVNDGRIRALLGNIYRLGITNIAVAEGDGRTLPTEAQFDRVLADVPCSAQGTWRKKAGHLPPRHRNFIKQTTRAQESLLRRAIELTRPGGVILYVTCTFDPAENEAVVSRVLADPPRPIDIEPIELAIPHVRGVAAYDGQSFDPRLDGAVRLYPHHLDSGGLFICRIRRLEAGDGEASGGEAASAAVSAAASDVAAGWSAPPEADPAIVSRALDVLESHYGVDPTRFEGLHWFERGDALWVHGFEEWPIDNWSPGRHWRLITLGLRAADLGGDGPPRPTNDLLQYLDSAITRNRLELDAQQWCDLFDGREVRIDDIERGHVALAFDGHVAGWGFVRDHRLQHHIPRGRSQWLRNVVAGRAGTEG
jgi:NOL1/NOP2/sun family putative RNA methylase